jgi:xylulokinase
VTIPDLVIGVDCSTTATKAVAFDASGFPVASARRPHPTHRPHPGHAEQDPEDWWRGLCACLDEIGARLGEERIAAVAITHQRETFALLDGSGQPVRPGILWLDERARPQVAELSARLGPETLRAITGKPPDPTPALYGLAWLAAHEPEAVARTARVVDVHAFLVGRLTGRAITSTASADPLGLLDLAALDWSDRLLREVALGREHMPALAAPGTVIGEVVTAACGLRPGTPVVAGGGDGQVCGLGLGVLTPGTAYLSLGSGAVCGIHAPAYRHDLGFRTLVSPSGEGFILETCLRTCTQLVDWVVTLTGRPLDELAAAAADVPPGADGLLLVPYWSGVMSPYWDDTARGTVTGLGLDHGPGHLFRAALEGVALEQAVALDALERTGDVRARELVLTGGGATSSLWCEIVATVLRRPLRRPPVADAGCLGAAILAAAGAGWHASIAAAAEAMVPVGGESFTPRPDWAPAYASALARYRTVHPALAAACR